ncbi:HMG domain-containing protein 3-like [Exaiptasia diaphana]|uniref:Uncharacterized protein n=1 Tax=Exaiptasia diaphana TaxID=2652724 RepID=A0A913YS11_EXADI|nr:HMG domain-containing protein 3-like [Exaiptasia diaphana]
MEVRDKAKTDQLWGENFGCFEKPSLDKEPQSNINIPDIVPSEYKSVETQPSNDLGDGMVHPITKSERHFVVGDRFHNSTNPHKSPLCAYHNINLCRQAYTITTSTQESENNRKNVQRLRSTCQQSFEVHYLFNYLMDFYLNENIVNKQKKSLENSTGALCERNTLGRFILKA